MRSNIPNEWLNPVHLEQATKVQKELAEQVITHDEFNLSSWIGGMDVSHSLYDLTSMIYASAIVLNQSNLKPFEEVSIAKVQPFPYVPGFLGFREAPALVEAYFKLEQKPEIVIVDGHGISHPRQLGIASHLGVLLDIPTIGVGKSILVGKPEKPLGDSVGSQVALIWKGKQIGILLRTKLRCNPLIISTGHRISLSTAVEIVLKCLHRYRLPEPTRQAHLAANRYRIQVQSQN